METFDPSDFFRLVDVFGVFANGLLGGALARKMNFDPVGFVVLAVVSGLGGGAIRDVLLNVRPVMLTDPAYLSTAFIGALLAFFVSFQSRAMNRALLLLDAAALGAWAATGTTKALGLGLHIIPAILLGTITAVGGGIIRDTLVGRIPSVFGGNPLYATLAVVAAGEMVVASRLHHPRAGMMIAIFTTTVLVMLARRWNWYLPGPLHLDINPVTHYQRFRRRGALQQHPSRTGSTRAEKPRRRFFPRF